MTNQNVHGSSSFEGGFLDSLEELAQHHPGRIDVEYTCNVYVNGSGEYTSIFRLLRDIVLLPRTVKQYSWP